MWQKELPNSVGDWLFLTMWDCGCCVNQCGIVWVVPTVNTSNFQNAVDLGNGFTLHWEGQKPSNEFKIEYVDFWQKIELPLNENIS